MNVITSKRKLPTPLVGEQVDKKFLGPFYAGNGEMSGSLRCKVVLILKAQTLLSISAGGHCMYTNNMSSCDRNDFEG